MRPPRRLTDVVREPEPPALVVPFFRASIVFGAAERRAFVRSLSPGAFETQIRNTGALFRQNLRRLFAAAAFAAAAGLPLSFVEGWKSNVILRGETRRVKTGSWCFALLLRLLQRRDLTAYEGRPLRREISRCTWEEAEAVAALAASRGGTVVGVSDAPCPSARRAQRTLHAAGGAGRVLTPGEALRASALSPTPAQAGLLAALAPRRGDTVRAWVLEAPNWAIHGLSVAGRAVRPGSMPLEQRIARRLRPDREARPAVVS